MKELDKLLVSMSIDDLLEHNFDTYSTEEREYLYERVTEIADQKCYQIGIEYNIRDVELVDKLEDKLKLIELALILAYKSKTNYDDVFSQVRMWDSIIYNHLLAKKIVVPPNTKHSKDSAYIGAFVKDPLIGEHKWVASFDLTSLYPSLIMQYNIGPETLIEPKDYSNELKQFVATTKIDVDNLLNRTIDTSIIFEKNVSLTPNGHFYRRDKSGFMHNITKKMFDERQAYKKMMLDAEQQYEVETDPEKKKTLSNTISRYKNLQLAVKVSLNSLYGAAGSEYFRFFDIRLATSITTAGQFSIRWIENKLNDYMNKLLKTENEDYVIASDTDSIYLSLDRLVSKTIVSQKPNADTREIIRFMDKVCKNKIQPFIDQSYAELAEYANAYEQKMIMKREALADKGIWTAKKRYILNVYDNEGVEYAKPKIKVMGLEVKKSSTPAFFRDKMEECIHIMLNSTEDKLISYVESVRDEMKKALISDIAFPRGVNGLEKFSDAKMIYGKGCPIHVRGALVYNHMLSAKRLNKVYPQINEGEKIKFIYMKEPNPIRSNVIAFPMSLPKEFDLETYIDYDTQFNKAFLEPIKIITESIGWKTEQTSSLESFFG